MMIEMWETIGMNTTGCGPTCPIRPYLSRALNSIEFNLPRRGPEVGKRRALWSAEPPSSFE